MPKLLVNHPTGDQELIEVDKTGGYFDDARVLWDERKDGQFPSGMIPSIGGLIRMGNNLNVDPVALSAAQSKKTTETTKEANRRQKIADARAAVLALDTDQDLTTAEIKAILKALVTLARGK